MPFEVLSAEGRDAERWRALIGGLPPERRDIHFLPEYGRIYRVSYGYEPRLAVLSTDEGYVLQPFVRRPLRDLPFLAGAPDAATFTDIANPYGFGGPLCSASDSGVARRLYAGFAKSFAEWCDRENIASEFASLHPFFCEHQIAIMRGMVAPHREKNVVYIDLTGGDDAILAGLNRGHRSSVAKARRAGVRVEKVEPTPRNLMTFNEIYSATMIRRKAAPRWFVPDRFFANCCALLGPRRASLFFASIGGEVECAYLLIHDFGTAYYHFAGTRDRHPELRANNLTMIETALWARKTGCSRYHLGGGVTSREDDTLLRFKAGFSDRRAPLYTYFCVRDQAVYDELCRRKRTHERETAGTELASDFLPLYRR